MGRYSEGRSLVVIGLGYIGLPLAQEACRSGLRVTGLDVSEAGVTGLNEGRSHVDDISASEVEAMQSTGFIATSDAACSAAADVVVISVPTPLSDD